MVKRVFIVVSKEWVYNPKGYDPSEKCQMKILGICETRKDAEREARDHYTEFKKFQWGNYVCFGDYDDLDGLFDFDDEHLRVIDHYIEDTDTEIRWEVLEWVTGDDGGYEIEKWTPDI